MKYQYIDEKGEHLHTLDGRPLIGTSTVCKIISKPLTWWASGMAVAKFGWLDPKKNPPEAVQEALGRAFEEIKLLDLPAYEKLVAEAYKAHSVRLKKAAKDGTDLHAELEQFVLEEMELAIVAPHSPKIQPFVDWARANVKKWLWAEGHCYSEELWTGGIADSGAEMNDGSLAVFDFKSAKDAYYDHFVQAGGYATALEESGLLTRDGELVLEFEKPFDKLIIVPFGAEVMNPVIRTDVGTFKHNFRNALALYKGQQAFENTAQQALAI